MRQEGTNIRNYRNCCLVHRIECVKSVYEQAEIKYLCLFFILFKSSNKNTTYNKNTTNKKLLLNVSFKSNQPSNDPTIGWKKKNNEPMLASINSNPLFQRKRHLPLRRFLNKVRLILHIGSYVQ